MSIINKIFFILNKKQKKNFYILSFLNFLNSFMELAGLVSLSVIILLTVNPELYLDKLNNVSFYPDLLKFGLVKLENLNFSIYFFASIFLITTIFKFLIKYYTINFSVKLNTEISNLLFKNFVNKKYIYLFDDTSSKLLNLANYHSGRFSNSIVNPVLNLISSISLIIILLISFIGIGGFKTLIALIFIFFISILVYLILSKFISRNEKNIIENDIKRQNILNEGFNNIKYLKLSKKYFRLIKHYILFGNIYGKSLIFNLTSLHVAKPILEISFLLIAVVFLSINLNIDNNSLIEYLPLISFILLSFYRMMPSVQIMYQSFVHIKGSLGTLDELMRVLSNETHQEKLIKDNDQEKINFNKDIFLENISFNYKDKENLFEDVSIDIKKNSCVAFYGKSGQGKSTIIDIICGLIEPSKGKLKIDGTVINEKNQLSYQNKIGYLSQNFYILNDTILNNVIFFEEINNENYIKAKNLLLRLFDNIEIKNFLENEEKVGENGIKLSQGQRQRLLITRLLFEDKEILILDEPTSSIDENNIHKLKKIVESLKKDKTVIITSHNKEILKVCDQIFVVDNNKIRNVEIDFMLNQKYEN